MPVTLVLPLKLDQTPICALPEGVTDPQHPVDPSTAVYALHSDRKGGLFTGERTTTLVDTKLAGPVGMINWSNSTIEVCGKEERTKDLKHGKGGLRGAFSVDKIWTWNGKEYMLKHTSSIRVGHWDIYPYAGPSANYSLESMQPLLSFQPRRSKMIKDSIPGFMILHESEKGQYIEGEELAFLILVAVWSEVKLEEANRTATNSAAASSSASGVAAAIAS